MIDPATKPWPRYPRYLVRADGAIIGPQGRLRKPILMGGYQRLTVYTPPTTLMVKVASVVCETFHGPRPAGMQVAHEDGNPLNDAASNLSWKTSKENAADRDRHGRQARGSRHPGAKLTEEDVRHIRVERREGVPVADLAARYGIGHSTVSMVANGRTWGHVR